MKKTFKRLGAVLLAAFMLLSTTICALADDNTQATTPTTSKITLNVSNVNDGDTVSAYQLVSYNDNGNGYKFFDGDGTKKGFKTYIESQSDIGKKTAEQYLAGLKAAGVNKLLEGYATECNKADAAYTLPTEPPAVTTVTAANSKATLTLEAGYYLLLTKTASTNNRVYTPLSAFIQMDGDTLVVHAGDSTLTEQDSAYTVSAKSAEGPTIDKKTNATKGSGDATWKETAAAGVDDIVRFYVEVNIPAYNNVSALNLTVNDTLTNLKYKEGSAKVYGSEPDVKGANGSKPEIKDAIKNSENVVAKDYAVNNGTGTQDLKFELDYQKIMGDNVAQAKTVYVYYEAIMQKEAVTGTNHQGANVATLTYSNAVNPGSEYTTNKKETDVYTYHLQVNKKKGGKDEALEGAKFSVYTQAEGGEPLKFVEVPENGTTYYRLAVDDEDGAVTQIDADFQIRGLDANTYYLDEVKTPKGYFAPAGRFQVVLTSKFNENGTHTGRLDGEKSKLTAVKETEDGKLVFAGSSVDTKISHQFNAGINNFSTPNLPTTGGTGTVLLSIGGVVLMAAGAYLLFFRKKKEN